MKSLRLGVLVDLLSHRANELNPDLMALKSVLLCFSVRHHTSPHTCSSCLCPEVQYGGLQAQPLALGPSTGPSIPTLKELVYSAHYLPWYLGLVPSGTGVLNTS